MTRPDSPGSEPLDRHWIPEAHATLHRPQFRDLPCAPSAIRRELVASGVWIIRERPVLTQPKVVRRPNRARKGAVRASDPTGVQIVVVVVNRARSSMRL